MLSRFKALGDRKYLKLESWPVQRTAKYDIFISAITLY
jgi:hypothetical protein